MENENKIGYADKIFSLNEEDRKQRELYLKGLANGSIQGPPTNIPFIDQKWVSNYNDNTITESVPHMSMIDFLYENNKDNLNDIALIFENKQITYGELFEKVDEYAQALMGHGYKEQDVIALPLPSTPESVFLFYAINKIGAVANLIDLRKSNEQIKYCITQAKTKGMFALDMTEEKMLDVIKDTGINDIVSLSAVESLSKPIQFLFNPKQYINNKKQKEHVVSLNNYLKNYDKSKKYEYPEYKMDRPAFIVYTSGTTNNSKAVVLTSDTANTRVHQYMTNGMIHSRQDVYLNVIPLFLAFGTIVGIHLPLSMGMKDVLIPSYDIEKTLQLIKKWKPQHLSLTPASYTKLINTPGFDKLDLSKVYTWGSGGDGINAEYENIINEKIAQQGSTQKLSNGYGGSEIGAPFSTQKEGVTVPGSVGIPLPGNNVIIYDHFTNEILPAGKIGDICMIVDHSMLEYIEKEELTNKTMHKFPNGQIGISLGDAGYVDEKGNLFIKGRYVDAAKNNNGQIIWPVDIENSIMSTKMAKNCAAITLNDDGTKIGLFVVPNDNIDKNNFEILLSDTMEKSNQLGIDYEVIYLNEMLISENGKVDRKKLRSMYGDNENNKKL